MSSIIIVNRSIVLEWKGVHVHVIQSIPRALLVVQKHSRIIILEWKGVHVRVMQRITSALLVVPNQSFVGDDWACRSRCMHNRIQQFAVSLVSLRVEALKNCMGNSCFCCDRSRDCRNLSVVYHPSGLQMCSSQD